MLSEKLRIAMFLLTDGSVTPSERSWKISFRSTSNLLISHFNKSFTAAFNRRLRIVNYDGCITAYCYSTEIAQELLQFTNSYRTKCCMTYPICPKLRGYDKKPCLICRPVYIGGVAYPWIQLPSSIFKFSEQFKYEILKIIASTEGHVIFSRVKGRRPHEYARRIVITCYHPLILEQFRKLFLNCGISCRKDNKHIIISGYDNLVKFQTYMRFYEDVKCLKGDAWRGLLKNDILKLMVHSYTLSNARERVCTAAESWPVAVPKTRVQLG